jgi:hypothetical protein
LDPSKPVPPSLPANARVRWRPLVRARLIGPRGHWDFDKALVDSGADDTVFRLGWDKLLGVPLRSDTGQGHRWRGKWYPLRYGDVELELTDDVRMWRWSAVIAFSPAAIPYALLGHGGCFQFLDVRFLDADRFVEFEDNRNWRGRII